MDKEDSYEVRRLICRQITLCLSLKSLCACPQFVPSRYNRLNDLRVKLLRVFGFSSFERCTETPLNLIFQARS